MQALTRFEDSNELRGLNRRAKRAGIKPRETPVRLNDVKVASIKVRIIDRGGSSSLRAAGVIDLAIETTWSKPITHHPGGITSYPTRNPFHFHESDLVHCTRDLPWDFESVVDWSHPRDQMMATFVRV